VGAIMKLKQLVVAISIIVFLLAVTFNPSKGDYVEWVNEQVTQDEGMLIGMISKPLIDSYTSKKNYGILTLYETVFDDETDEKISAIGVFNNFIWVNGGE
jgi:hypothetical protein